MNPIHGGRGWLKILDRWRTEAERAGFKGLFLVRVESYTDLSGDPRSMGFDAALEFQPRAALLWKRIFRRKWWHIRRLGTHEPGLCDNYVLDYETLLRWRSPRRAILLFQESVLDGTLAPD
jgi:hypothetical protein